MFNRQITATELLLSFMPDTINTQRYTSAGPGIRNYHKGKGTNTYKPNGAQECVRRRAQIANGQLRAENGLVV